MNVFQKAGELLSDLAKSKKAVTAAAALGILGMLMILLSGGGDSGGAKDTPEPKDVCENNWADYCSRTEMRLEKILSSIDGVGKVNVMITVGSAERYLYVREECINGERIEQEYVKVKTSGGEEALVRTVMAPEITGVAAVCEGGRSDRVKEEIYRTITSVLGIPSNRVYVAAME